MKIALLCIVALLHLGPAVARSASSTSKWADEPTSTEESCKCAKHIVDAIYNIGDSLNNAIGGGGGISTEKAACPSSLGLSSVQPAMSCNEILQCNPFAQSGNYWLKSTVTDSREVYCNMGTLCDITGGWARLVYLNMTEPSASCPTTFTQVEEPARLCGGSSVGGTCVGVTYPTEGIRFTKACGQARGYQYYSTDAFGTGVTDINTYYVDGVSITYGDPRQHLWTYASGLSDDYNYAGGVYNCPCAVVPGRDPPDFVGDNYYCESGITGQWEYNNRIAYDDPLWDGEGCTENNDCCDSPGLPWFYRSLPLETTDDIEVRICFNEAASNENVYVDLVEVYVQ